VVQKFSPCKVDCFVSLSYKVVCRCPPAFRKRVADAGPSFLEQKRPAESLELSAEEKKAAEVEEKEENEEDKKDAEEEEVEHVAESRKSVNAAPHPPEQKRGEKLEVPPDLVVDLDEAMPAPKKQDAAPKKKQVAAAPAKPAAAKPAKSRRIDAVILEAEERRVADGGAQADGVEGRLCRKKKEKTQPGCVMTYKFWKS
jgi:hypothetical protein